ncbi:MAG: hypothetical protein ACJ8FD_09220 [Bradyrhizobium canariense]|jgi:hypothetical protein
MAADIAAAPQGAGHAVPASSPYDLPFAIDYFLLFGLWPAGVLPDENGDGVAPPFFMFLSAFGFFFSLLLRI